MDRDSELSKASEVGIGMSGNVRVYSSSMPSVNEDLEDGVKDQGFKASLSSLKVISWDDYRKSDK